LPAAAPRSALGNTTTNEACKAAGKRVGSLIGVTFERDASVLANETIVSQTKGCVTLSFRFLFPQ